MTKIMKNVNSTVGAQKNCINFEPCPLCYGCRNYNSADIRCDECFEDKKMNICRTDIHTISALNMMLKNKEIIHIIGEKTR